MRSMGKRAATEGSSAADSQLLVAGVGIFGLVEIMSQLQRITRLACNGFRAGESVVPPFEVGRGEIVKIEFSPRCAQDIHIAEHLFCGNVLQSGRIATVELAMQRSGWREFLHAQTTSEWLIANCGMTRDDAIEQLQRVQVDPDAVLSQLAGNPRWMIGFIAAMHDQPDVLVFTTTGCDPLGMQRALEAVRSRREEIAAVYLSCFSGLNITEPDYSVVLEAQSFERQIA